MGITDSEVIPLHYRSSDSPRAEVLKKAETSSDDNPLYVWRCCDLMTCTGHFSKRVIRKNLSRSGTGLVYGVGNGGVTSVSTFDPEEVVKEE